MDKAFESARSELVICTIFVLGNKERGHLITGFQPS